MQWMGGAVGWRLGFGMLLCVLVGGPAAAQSSTADTALPRETVRVADTLAQRTQACVGCHGREGRATRDGYYPRIAGKPAGYLFNQLVNFRTGQRTHRAMNHLVQNLSDDFLREIAAYFAALDLPYPPSQPGALSPADAERAQRLVRDGVPERNLPACGSCHGSRMAGRLPAIPGLLALPRDYLLGQLGAWRTDSRRAAAPDCMARIAQRLQPDEIALIATWLSSQSLPAGTHPEPPAEQPLPLECGSGSS